MSEVLRVQWTIIAQTAPQPWLTCSRCGETRRFRSSDRVRVNSNGKRVDAWLIYKCTDCDDTWNRPVLERRPVHAIDPGFLMALSANDADVVRRLAFDLEGLRRRTDRVAEFDDVLVIKHVLSGDATSARQLDILCVVPQPVGLRVDRLLANELGLSRSGIQRLEGSGALVALPKGSRLRRAVRDGTRLLITSRDVPARQTLIAHSRPPAG
jgi:hypothetical protein